MRLKRMLIVSSGALSWLASSLAPVRLHAADVQFNRDIRPIFTATCFNCHGPDSASRKADLRFDRRDDALKAKAFVPGKPDQSEMIQRVFSDDKDEMMPPPSAHMELKPAQKELLKQWVAAGAVYEPLWSFIAPKRPELPAVKNAAWVRNPIDRFVLAKLEHAGLQPAPEADRRTLARRLSLDLIGLPPTPEQVTEFLNDNAPDAYEKYVDRLMASPRWGEHRGRYWLDAARYADTAGIHYDTYREMWTYREWVINALNRNMPFDQFTIEQLAGDLLPDRTVDQQIASGFNRCNITTNEGGAIPDEYLVLYARDRTETAGAVFMGLTVGCAVCHDHKFDPFLQKEFYQLSAYFNNTTQGAMDGNRKDTPPVIFVPQGADRARLEELAVELPAVQKELEARKKIARGEFEKWLATASAEKIGATAPSDGLQFEAPLNEGAGNTIALTVNGKLRDLAVKSGIGWAAGYVADQSFRAQPGEALEIAEAGDFDIHQPYSAAAWVKLGASGQSGSVVARMDSKHDFRGWDLWIEGGRVGAHLINHWEQDAMKVLSQHSINTGVWNHLMVTYDGSGKAAGLKIFVNGVQQPTQVMVDRLRQTTRTKVPLKIAQRDSTNLLDGALIQDVRVYGRALTSAEAGQLSTSGRAVFLLNKPADKRGKPEIEDLYKWYATAIDKPTQELQARLAKLQQEEAAIKGRGAIAQVMQERPGEAGAFVLFRGDYDKRRDPVKAATPSMLPPDAGRPAAQSPRAGEVARAGRPSALGPRHGESLLAGTVRNGDRPFGERFRLDGRNALASGTDRLVGGRVPRIRLGHEEDVQADGHLSGVPAIGRDHAGEIGKGRRESIALARPAVPHGRRDDSRLRAGRQRIDGRQDRRAKRATVSAAEFVGSGRHARQRHAALCAGPRRQVVSPQRLHVLEADGAAGFDGRVQRSEPRDLHGAPRTD